jgi:hypothetical protein
MDPQENIQYLNLIKEYLYREWLVTGDPETKAQIECIGAEIAELEKHSE